MYTNDQISSEKVIFKKDSLQNKTLQLRFPNFDNNWQEVKLKDITNINPKTSEIPNSFYYIDLESVNSGKLINKNKIDKKNAPSRAQRLLQKNDILFSSVRPYQQNNLIFKFDNDSYVASTGFIQIRSDKSNINYLYYYLHTYSFLNKVLKLCTGSNYPTISSNDLKNIKIKIPTKEEQNKIGTFLSKIDKKIMLMEQKHDIIKKEKKVMLQQLLSKNILELESKIFQDKWDVKKLSEIAKVGDGVHQTPNYVDSGVKFISVEDIDDFSKTTKFIKKEEYEKYKMKTQKNDIFLTRIGTVGKSNIIKENTDYAYYVSLSLIRSNKEINSNYLNQYIKSNIFQRELWKRTLQNASPMKINLIDLKQCLVAFPPIEEQEKISNILCGIDKKIELLNKQINLMKTYKKGLLQKMFI